MRIEITKQDYTMVFEVAEESGINVFDKIREVFDIISMNGESFPSGVDFFKKRLTEHDANGGPPQPQPPQPQPQFQFGIQPFGIQPTVKELIEAAKQEASSYGWISTHKKIDMLIEIVERLDNEMPRMFSTPYAEPFPVPYVPPTLPYWPMSPNTQVPMTGDPLPSWGTTTCIGTAMCQADGMGDDSGSRGD